MDDQQLISIINQAAYEVRQWLAPGYLEAVYKMALIHELQLRGLHTDSELPIRVYYKDKEVGFYKLDILVEERIVIELKAVTQLLPIHEAQLVNYLTATGYDTGILINYGGERFAFRIKDRVYNNNKTTEP